MMRCPWHTFRNQSAVATAFFSLLLFAGCTAARYRAAADREVYRILSAKQQKALARETPFSIDWQPQVPEVGLPRGSQPLIPPAEAPAAGGPAETAGSDPANPPVLLTLDQAVVTAIRNSREYQRRKEDLYLSALQLTQERHLWSPRFTNLVSGKWRDQAQDESLVGETTFGISQLLATGGSITLGLSSTFLKHLTGDPQRSAISVLNGKFVQSLWRGAGLRIARENLTQAERDVIYAVRAFARYHRSFAVTVATGYYGVLKQRAIVGNEYNNSRMLTLARERAEMLAKAGRMPEFQLDQTRQDELRARNSFISAEQLYWDTLDSFKIDFGLPVSANLDLDVKEWERLLSRGILHPAISLEQATRQALALRLDLQTTEDAVADAERKVNVARNSLGADVNLVASANVPTADGTRPGAFRFEQGTYDAGLEVELPLDRKEERNRYRRSLIDWDRAKREAQSMRENIQLQVRQVWRNLQQARESFDIQQQSVTLARRRVEGTSLLLEAGRATSRDVLESQAALLEAQNALARVLVTHTIARLELWRDMETLLTGPEGQIEEENRVPDQPATQN